MTRDTFVQIAAWIFFTLLVLLPVAAAGVDCSRVNVSPVADFEYSVVPAETAPIMVNFYSTSKGGRAGPGGEPDPIEAYLWRFGDGYVSEQASPLHTYATSSARYQDADRPFGVTLMVTTGCGRVAAATKNVSVYCLNQTAGFTIVQPVGDGPYTAPVALYLKDTSLHVDESVTSYHYTLWDSGMTRLFWESTEKDPALIIRNGGSYVIRQDVFKGCSNPSLPDTEMTKTIGVTASASSNLIPMETIPYTTTVPESPATATQPAIPSPAASDSRTTTPSPLLTESPFGTGTLSVVTDPASAEVFVNDILLGSSPVTIPGFKAGSYILRLEKDGYPTKTVAIEIMEGKVTEYSTALDVESGWTRVVPIPAAAIIIVAGAGAAVWYLRKKKRR